MTIPAEPPTGAANPIETVALTSAIELVQELLPTSGRLWRSFRDGADPDDWIFRGQRDAKWGLQPAAFRKGAFDRFAPLSNGNESQKQLEMSHLLRFIDLVNDQGHNVPGDHPGLRDDRPHSDQAATRPEVYDLFPNTVYLDMCALAQHYGIPTRLLDWTVKPLIAAYFAALDSQNSEADEIAVWALNRRAIELRLSARIGFQDESIVSLVDAPTATNANLASQGGLFTLVQARRGSLFQSQPPPENIDDLIRSTTHLETTDIPVLCKFTLRVAEAPKVLRILNEHRVHASSVSPGLAGIVETLRERALYARGMSELREAYTAVPTPLRTQYSDLDRATQLELGINQRRASPPLRGVLEALPNTNDSTEIARWISAAQRLVDERDG